MSEYHLCGEKYSSDMSWALSVSEINIDWSLDYDKKLETCSQKVIHAIM